MHQARETGSLILLTRCSKNAATSRLAPVCSSLFLDLAWENSPPRHHLGIGECRVGLLECVCERVLQFFCVGLVDLMNGVGWFFLWVLLIRVNFAYKKDFHVFLCFVLRVELISDCIREYRMI